MGLLRTVSEIDGDFIRKFAKFSHPGHLTPTLGRFEYRRRYIVVSDTRLRGSIEHPLKGSIEPFSVLVSLAIILGIV